MIRLTFIIALFFTTLQSFAQKDIDTAMVRTYGGERSDIANDVIETSDGYFILGTTSSSDDNQSNFYLVKIDSDLNFEWSRVYGESSVNSGLSISYDGDTYYYLTGFTLNSTGQGYDALVIKIDNEGSIIWSRTIGGADWDFGYDAETTSEGGLIVVGETWSYGEGQNDTFMFKLNAEGEEVWSQTYGDLREDFSYSIARVPNTDEFFITGNTETEDDNIASVTQLIDINGDTIWTESFLNDDGFDEKIQNSVVTADSSIVSGGFLINDDGERKKLLRKVSYDGELIWTRFWDDLGNQEIRDVALTESLILINGVSDVFGLGGLSMYLMRTSNLGFYVSAAAFGEAGNEVGNAMIIDSQNRPVYVGYSDSYSELLEDFYLVRLPNTHQVSEYVLDLDHFVDDFSSVNIQEPIGHKLSALIYPNPATNSINVRNDQMECDELAIFDGRGQMVYRQKIQGTLIEISLDAFDSGIYSVQLYSNRERVKVSRFIKK